MRVRRPGTRLSADASSRRSPAQRRSRALNLLFVTLLCLGAASALLGGLSEPARAASCDQGSSLITSDWIVTTPQVCRGILYTVDGSVIIQAGGSLTLINGGLDFAKDATHPGYNLTVEAGGSLVLDHSLITVQRVAIDPYLKLAVNVSGAGSQFTMMNGSLLQFPGWFNATGATIRMADSTITGFTTAQVQITGLDVDDNNDSAVISWASTAATLVRSRIDHVFENWTLVAPYVSASEAANITLTAGSSLTAYDSFLDVDYSNVTGLHNALHVDATSIAYLFGVTINRSQDPTVETSWEPAFVPDPGGTIDLLRWLEVSVRDATAFPVTGAAIWSTFSANGTTAGYPDDGFSAVPSAETLAFLGRTASGATAWNRTDSNGLARIPLFTDEITWTSLPNANSFGNYRFVVSYNTSSFSGGVAFNPYPAGTVTDNRIAVTVSLADVYVRTPPDLALHASDYPALLNLSQNAPFTIHAVIYNQGQTTATGVSIAAFLDGNRSAPLARVDGLTVSQSANATLDIGGIASLGAHTIELAVDPNDTIYEGGPAQKVNNVLNVSVVVQPPPGGFVAIAAPDVGQALTPGSTLSVSGYVRDPNAIGIVGVALTIELRSGTTVLANAPAISGLNGFFLATLTLPANLTDGSYLLAVTPASNTIQPDSRAVSVQTPVPFLDTLVPLIGLPWWLFLVLLAVIAAILIGVTVYIKVYGLGKMVECGECGAYIHADAAVCPRCGVEFEKDLAKCSNCQAWIPVEVKQCPECGIEFATGELDQADYQEKMRLQYDEIVEKFHTEAQRQLRRTLTDKEFQEWWRTQPTFVTYDDWRREEEEVRRKGSKPCPNCGTLNSVTAKVCHTCGTLMKGQLPRKNGRAEDARSRQSSAPTGPAGRSMISPSTGSEEEPPKKASKEPPGNAGSADQTAEKDDL